MIRGGLVVTLRQILDVLWKRKWIVVAVTVVALLVALAYLQMRTVTYSTSSIVRLNSVVATGAATGEISGVAVDVGSDAVTSEDVVTVAGAQLGEAPDVLADSIQVSIDDSTGSTRMQIAAFGDSPVQAQERANAVTAAYVTYVQDQMTDVLTTLTQRQADAITAARDLQKQVAEDPTDSIASTNLATALSKMTSLNLAIENVNNAGAATAVVSSAYPGEPTVPSPIVVLLLALTTGLIVGIAAALVRDQFDNRLRGEDEILQTAGVRSLGELNWDRGVARTQPPLPVARNDRTDLSERLRTLRSTLQVFLPARGAVVVLTSVEPGDGKSFVSANLALAWARAGRRVILVDGDLRRPDLGRYLESAADGEGLAEILQEHEIGESLRPDAVESRLNATAYRRLRVLPAGAEPPDSADLLARPVLRELMSHLRSLADVVIVDSPPAIGMSDAAQLALQSDGAVVIASVRKTDRVLLNETVAGLRASGAEVLGVVANRGRRQLPKAYSAYYTSRAADSRVDVADESGVSTEAVAELRRKLHARTSSTREDVDEQSDGSAVADGARDVAWDA